MYLEAKPAYHPDQLSNLILQIPGGIERLGGSFSILVGNITDLGRRFTYLFKTGRLFNNTYGDLVGKGTERMSTPHGAFKLTINLTRKVYAIL